MQTFLFVVIIVCCSFLPQNTCTPGSGPPSITTPTPPSYWVTRLIIPAKRTLLFAAAPIIARRTWAVASCAVPAKLTGSTHSISGRTELVIFTVATTKKNRIRVYYEKQSVLQTDVSSPTSFHSHCHISQLHMAGCRSYPGNPGGTDTARLLRHTCCV